MLSPGLKGGGARGDRYNAAMMQPVGRLRRLGALLAVVFATTQVAMGDWPAYRGDAARSGVAAQPLPVSLQEQWTFAASQPPQPAWPKPARSSYWQELSSIEPRVVDDHAFHPVISADAVYFGSSADDQVYCIELDTGEVRWTFFTDGPVRYAPVLTEGRLYFGSDDGYVYCVTADDGNLVWRHRVGPGDRMIPGNGRLISIWPVRTGLLVDGGVVYATAGLFPSQGVWACALNAADGEPVWKHELGDYSPQGYMLASRENLILPTGRSNPIAISRATGEVVKSYNGVGGTFALLMDDVLVAGRGNDGSLAVSDVASRERLVNFAGRQMVVTADRSYLQSDTHLIAIDRKQHVALVRRKLQLEREHKQIQEQLKKVQGDAARPLRSRLLEVAKSLDETQQGIAACELWKIDNTHHDAMALVGDVVVVGGANVVKAFDVKDGKKRWQAAIDGRGLGLAAAHGRLIVTTDTGRVYCFGEGAAKPKKHRTIGLVGSADDRLPGKPWMSDEHAAFAKRVVNGAASRKGYCLVLNAGASAFALALAEQTDWQIVVVDRRAEHVAALREALASTGLYGRRIAVHHVTGDSLPMTDYFANVIVMNPTARADRNPWPDAEVQRVLRPSGGMAWLAMDGEPIVRGPLDGAGTWDHMYGSTANTSFSADEHIAGRLQLQWFGGPGPNRMVDRHLRGPPPLAVDGRLIVMGENAMVGVDAYNGTTLWEIDLPKSQRYSMPYDAGYVTATAEHVYIAVNGEAWTLDITSGEKRQAIGVPGPAGNHWGYMAFSNGCLVGTAQKPTAARTEPSRGMIDQDYRSRQGLVTSDMVFRLDPTDSTTLWTWSRGAIINPTITQADGKLFFLESRNAEARNHATGRIPLETLAKGDLYLVCLEVATGEHLWERKLDMTMCNNIVYLAHSADRLVLAGTRDLDDARATYHVRVLSAANGEEIWRVEHPGRRGDLYHGEQVQHPVVMGDILVSEPYLYDFATGKPLNIDGGDAAWTFARPGHSCGTMTAAGQRLFFRANNPTMLDLSDAARGANRFTRLAPTRTGCWINVLPALGLVIIPEASAGCVCHYSLQTSMAFLPVRE